MPEVIDFKGKSPLSYLPMQSISNNMLDVLPAEQQASILSNMQTVDPIRYQQYIDTLTDKRLAVIQDQVAEIERVLGSKEYYSKYFGLVVGEKDYNRKIETLYQYRDSLIRKANKLVGEDLNKGTERIIGWYGKKYGTNYIHSVRNSLDTDFKKASFIGNFNQVADEIGKYFEKENSIDNSNSDSGE